MFKFLYLDVTMSDVVVVVVVDFDLTEREKMKKNISQLSEKFKTEDMKRRVNFDLL